MKKKIIYALLSVVSFLSLATLFFTTSPENKPLLLVFVPVLFVWVALFSTVKLLLLLFMNTSSRLHTVGAAVGVSFIVLIFLLSGVGQLSTVDLVLIVILAFVCAFYFYRTWV